MKLIATIANATQQYDVHLEVGDDEAGRARIADALHEMQERFVPRGEQPKKTAQRSAGPAVRPQPNSSAEADREK